MLGNVTPQPATFNLNPGLAVKLAPPPSSASAEIALGCLGTSMTLQKEEHDSKVIRKRPQK